MSILDGLTEDECRALMAWFHGGRSYVQKIEGYPHVFMGKAECEWVDFESVWLGKFQQLGLITVEETRRFTALGVKDQPLGVEYKIEPTSKGWDAHSEYWGG